MNAAEVTGVSRERFLAKATLALAATAVLFVTFAGALHPLFGSGALMLLSTGMVAGIEPASDSSNRSRP